MDKTEFTQEFSSQDTEPASGLGEYVWFAIILLCIVSLVAFQTHG